jgi:hypothetical protein
MTNLSEFDSHNWEVINIVHRNTLFFEINNTVDTTKNLSILERSNMFRPCKVLIRLTLEQLKKIQNCKNYK